MYFIPVGFAMLLIGTTLWIEPRGATAAILVVGCFVLISMAILIAEISMLPVRIAEAMEPQPEPGTGSSSE